MRDAIVIGSGIMGATIAKGLQHAGMKDVLVIDDRRAMSGTRPSGGHLRPAWFSQMSVEQYTPAIELLEQLWGMKEEEYFITQSNRSELMWRVDTDLVLASPFSQGKVASIRMLDNYPIVHWSKGEDRCRLLVVATGAWAGELVEGLKVTPKQGVSFRVEGVLQQRIIHQWAPYKQVVSHQQTKTHYWVGDGSAILHRNWTPGRTDACWKRCFEAVGMGVNPLSRHGFRPYCPPINADEPCYLTKIGPRAWVATGAGKSGTIAAGWSARRIIDASI